MGDTYFANLPTNEIGSRLVEKVEEYYRYIQSNGHYYLWKDVYRMYYYGFFAKGEVLTYGKQGEKRKLNVNHFKSLLENIKVLTTDQRPVFEPQAVNSDYKSAAQCNLARGLLDYYINRKNIELTIDKCLDFALQAGEGYIVLEWNSKLGKVLGELSEEEPEELDEETDETEEREDKEEVREDDDEDIAPDIKREGDIASIALHPIDVVRDYMKDTTENHTWYIIRRRVNKFDLAAKYPRFEKEVLETELDSTNVTLIGIDDYDFKKFGDTDQTYVFTLRHDRTASVPNGRQVEFLSDGTVLFDGDLPYSEMGVYCMMPSSRENTAFGYTIAFDLLPIQKTVDMLDSTVTTNQSTFGVQNILTQKGSGLTTAMLTGGLNKLEFSGDFEPKALQLTQTAPEIFNYRTVLVQDMETISGVNSVARGNPEASLRSGSALALVQSMAIQFNSGMQKSYIYTLEQLGTGIINMLKDYATAPRVALIAGISKKAYLKEFKGDDLQNVDRVTIQAGNPLSKTQAGRQQIADSLVERGLIKSPEQFLQVLNTGSLDPLIEGETAEIMNIRSENERLSMGDQVSMIYTDNHWLHIKEHKCVLSSPDSREVPDIVTSTLTHINEHIQALRSTDPGILMILGQQPIPSPVNSVEGGMQSPAVPMQPEENTPQQGQIGTPPPGGPEAAPSGEGNTGIGDVNMPSMPTNPLSGEKFNPETGGL